MPNLVIRAATASDASLVHGLIRDLAAAQDLLHEMRSTVADIRRDGFGERPLFGAVLAFLDGRPVGLALHYPTYSTWAGRPNLFVEDLFVDETERGTGIGRALLAHLAGHAMALGCERMELAVRAENEARGFYERLGLERKGSWLPYAVGGEALRALADKASSDGA